MGQVLIHTQGGGAQAAPHQRDSGQLQQALNGAVLAVFSVEHRKGCVQGERAHSGGVQNQKAAGAPVRGENRRAGVPGVLIPGVRRQSLQRAGVQQPLSLAGDAQGIDLIFLRVQMGEDRMGGLK